MHVTGHNAIAKDDHAFVLSAIIEGIDNDLKVLQAGKNIYPIDHSK
jgi:hypothetical protein